MYSKLDVWICSLDDRFRKLRHAAMQPNSRKQGSRHDGNAGSSDFGPHKGMPSSMTRAKRPTSMVPWM